MFVKLVIVLMLLAIIVSLFSSACFLVKDDSQRKRTLTGLKLRVTLSVLLVAFMLLAYHFGWIQPHAPGR